MNRLPIRPGTARRLGLRRPGEWSDTMERCTRPGWGSTAWGSEHFSTEWATTSGTSWIMERRP